MPSLPSYCQTLTPTPSTQVMAVEVMRTCHTTEEVISRKKAIQKAQVDQDRLREVIHRNKSKDDFLMMHR